MTVRSRQPVSVTALLAACLAFPGLLAAQSAEVTYPANWSETMPLSGALGDLSRKVSTSNATAQAYVNQGIRLIWAFNPPEGARSFHEAQKLDPNCAMCFWGEAWGWGPYINGGMNAAAGPRAYAAIQKAVALKDRATPVERALIDAMAVRYEPTLVPARRAMLDTAYSKAMAAVYSRYPKDLEVGALYAESLFLLNTGRANFRMEDPSVQALHKVLEEVLDVDIHYPGACHLYVHATEGTQRPDKAEECAQFLSNSMPGASHINHMPSHTYNQVGRWGDATAANVMAVKSDQRARLGDGQAFAIYATHNLAMLLYSASWDGQGAVAMTAAQDLARLQPGAITSYLFTLVRFGRFEDVLDVPVPQTAAAQQIPWNFARGYAHLRLGHADSARVYLDKTDLFYQVNPAAATGVGAIVSGILRGEVLRAEGKIDAGIAALEEASGHENRLPYAEPGQLPFSPKHWLGAALLEAKRPADAERVYRAELVLHPHNGWSLYGLADALTAQNKTRDSEQAMKEFTAAFARTDTFIKASRF